MKVWSTKYALTVGVEAVDVDESSSFRGMVSYTPPGCYTQYLHGEGKEWHRTREAAVARAEEMRTSKIASLRKQIAKLEAMRF